MKQRMLTAVIGLPLILLVLFSPIPAVILAVMAASLIGLYEYMKAVGIWENKPLCIMGMLAAVLIPLCFRMKIGSIQTILYLYVAALFVLLLIDNKKTTWSQLSYLAMGLVYIPYFLSHILYIRDMELGRFYIWLVFIGAFITDSCAYFVGCGIGKRKLCSTISPKKTVEGAIGGIVGCGIAFLIFGVVVNLGFAVQFSLWRLFIAGILCAVISEVGDLVASMLKRQFAIKDFGNLLPGHGGILDRCDSIILVAPALFLILQQMGVLVA